MLGLGEEQAQVLQESASPVFWGLDCSQAAAPIVPLPGADNQDSSCPIEGASTLPSGPITLPLALLTAMSQTLEGQAGTAG